MHGLICLRLARLLDAGCDDGKSELLLCKIFTLIAGELFRGFRSVALEFIVRALRRAQAYHGVMSSDERGAPQRSFQPVAFIIKGIQLVGGDAVWLQWQLQDILPKKTELKAKHWVHGLSELCKVIRHQFDEHHRRQSLGKGPGHACLSVVCWPHVGRCLLCNCGKLRSTWRRLRTLCACVNVGACPYVSGAPGTSSRCSIVGLMRT